MSTLRNIRIILCSCFSPNDSVSRMLIEIAHSVDVDADIVELDVLRRQDVVEVGVAFTEVVRDLEPGRRVCYLRHRHRLA